MNATVLDAPGIPERVCDDPSDDKFLACALAGSAKIIISGDKHLLNVSGYRGIDIIKPRVFLETHIREKPGR